MILSKGGDKQQSVWKAIRPLLLLSGLLLIGWQLLYPSYLLWLTKKTDGESVIYCDMEHRWKRYFISGGKFFEGSRTRSAVRSRSG
ncbi:MAG: hypothetical protein AAF990_26200, partial [Bacteroidota bacterium]